MAEGGEFISGLRERWSGHFGLPPFSLRRRSRRSGRVRSIILFPRTISARPAEPRLRIHPARWHPAVAPPSAGRTCPGSTRTGRCSGSFTLRRTYSSTYRNTWGKVDGATGGPALPPAFLRAGARYRQLVHDEKRDLDLDGLQVSFAVEFFAVLLLELETQICCGPPDYPPHTPRRVRHVSSSIL